MLTYNELPIFVREDASNLAYCDVLRWKKQRTCLALTRQLKFFEFDGKQTLRCFDLRQTVLRVESSRLQNYGGPKSTGAIKHDVLTDDASTSVTSKSSPTVAEDTRNESLNELASELNFGRYINRNKELYILLQCWDKLLVFRYPQNMHSASFCLVVEYTNVIEYRLVHDKVQYSALVKIFFEGGQTLCTDFQNDRGATATTDYEATTAIASECNRFLKGVIGPRSELLLHRVMTQRDFVHMSNRQIFGSVYKWSPVLAEKQQLTRCGDIWLRFIAHEALVIGVTLQNSTDAVVSKLQIFQLDAATNTHSHGINYKQRIFEIHRRLKMDGDKLAQYLNCLDDSFLPFDWHESCDQQLLADGKIVLLIMIPLADIVNEELVHLFLHYETQKSCGQFAASCEKKLATKTFSQQLYLRCLNAVELMCKHPACSINFNDLSLSQDSLTVMISQKAACLLQFVYINKGDHTLLMALLADHLQCDMYKNDSSEHFNPIIKDHTIGLSNACIDDKPTRVFYWNRQPMSEWHGTLLVRELSAGDNVCTFKIYARNETKLKLMLRMLFELLLEHRLNICDVQLGTSIDTANDCACTIRLTYALRHELNAWRAHISPSNCRPQQDCAMKTSLERNERQLASDLLATVIKTK